MSNTKPDIWPVYTEAQLAKAWADRGFSNPTGIDDWMQAIRSGQTDFLTARVDNKIRGTGMIRWAGVHPRDTSVAERLASRYPGIEPIPTFYDLWVDEEYRRRGIGEAIMKAAHRMVIGRPNATKMMALSVETNKDKIPARKLYRKLGYKIISLEGKRAIRSVVPRPNESGGFDPVEINAYVMTKDLSKTRP